jgi:FtsH-binding integral membrane protein
MENQDKVETKKKKKEGKGFLFWIAVIWVLFCVSPLHKLNPTTSNAVWLLFLPSILMLISAILKYFKRRKDERNFWGIGIWLNIAFWLFLGFLYFYGMEKGYLE